MMSPVSPLCIVFVTFVHISQLCRDAICIICCSFLMPLMNEAVAVKLLFLFDFDVGAGIVCEKPS